ncbi:mCG1049841 [Mus musculus]|nr:mCG1049841 [Mus musculus]
MTGAPSISRLLDSNSDVSHHRSLLLLITFGSYVTDTITKC